MILGIRIQNFEVLHDVTLGLSREDLRSPGATSRVLAELSALIGENSVGKSSLFRSLEFLNLSIREGLALASTEGKNTGFTQLKSRNRQGDMSFDLLVYSDRLKAILLYYIQITSDKHGRPRMREERVEQLAIDADQIDSILNSGSFTTKASQIGRLETVMDLSNGQGKIRHEGKMEKAHLLDRKQPAISSYGRLMDYEPIVCLYRFIMSWYFCRFSDQAEDILSRQYKEKHRKQLESGNGAHHHLNEDGSNLGNVIRYMRSHDESAYKDMIETVRRRLSQGSDLLDRVLNQSASAGETKLFSLFLLLYDPDPRPVLFIENPDHGLYYNVVDELAQLMREYVIENDDKQILLTTHNHNFVENLSPPELWIIYRPTTESEGSAVVNAADLPLIEAFYQEGVGLSAMWYAGHLDPMRQAEGPIGRQS